MNITELVLTLTVLGFVAWIILQIPMPAVFRNIIFGVMCFALVIWLLQSLGLISGVHGLRLR